MNNDLLPKSGYAAFDAISLRNLIINRLNTQGVYTDQNFIGSNLASITDIVSYAYNTLIYYLSRTSSEAMFTEAQLLENINKIVKLIGYKPIGYQTSTLTFQCSSVDLTPGLYTIPRYTLVNAQNVVFSFNEDITFFVPTTGTVEIESLSDEKILYQGAYKEYTPYTAVGQEHETVVLEVSSPIDHMNVDVYVREAMTAQWYKYEEVDALTVQDSFSKCFERRLNENLRYEIKFGNGINGRKLQAGDIVAVYYLQSDLDRGIVGPNALTALGTKVTTFQSSQFQTILTSIQRDSQISYATTATLQSLAFTNTVGSTLPVNPETPTEIKANAPAFAGTAKRLVTANDYRAFLKTHFRQILNDAVVLNNWEYNAQIAKYYYDIGVINPLEANNNLSNQVRYTDACNFNNVYIVAVPKTSRDIARRFLLPAQKELILSDVNQYKLLTTEVTFADPIFKAVDLGVTGTTIANRNQTQLKLYKLPQSRRSNQAIVRDVVRVFTTYFTDSLTQIGRGLSLTDLTQSILAVDGIERFETVNGQNAYKGLSVLVWNPDYPTLDQQVVFNNQPGSAAVVYFLNTTTLQQRIVIEEPVYTALEY